MQRARTGMEPGGVVGLGLSVGHGGHGLLGSAGNLPSLLGKGPALRALLALAQAQWGLSGPRFTFGGDP